MYSPVEKTARGPERNMSLSIFRTFLITLYKSCSCVFYESKSFDICNDSLVEKFGKKEKKVLLIIKGSLTNHFKKFLNNFWMPFWLNIFY